jgi:hypothetical protein
VCLADLKGDESNHRKVKLKCEEVQGKDLLLNFHGEWAAPAWRALFLFSASPLRCAVATSHQSSFFIFFFYRHGPDHGQAAQPHQEVADAH